MSDLARIRARFPHPVRMGSDAYYQRRAHERYCVGGAVCKFYRLEKYIEHVSAGDEFMPDKLALRDALEYLNPLLGDDRAYAFACGIIDNNDCERFEDAWTKADEALDWRP